MVGNPLLCKPVVRRVAPGSSVPDRSSQVSGRGSCSPESSCCDLDIPPTTGSEAVRRVGILMGGPGSGRPKSRHGTVESCLAEATVDSGYTWQDQTMIRERIQQ